MILEIGKCGNCPLMGSTMTKYVCEHNKNWDDENWGFNLLIKESLNLDSIHPNCPLRNEELTLRIK